MSHETPSNPDPLLTVVAKYPAIELLADAQSYAATAGETRGLSGEQLRTTKSIAVLEWMASGDMTRLLGENADALQPGYAIYHHIVREGITKLGEGDPELGKSRMAKVLSVHDIAKSASVAELAATAHGTTDHDMALSQLVGDDFRALDGHVSPHIVDSLRTTVGSDLVLRGFFARERGIDPGFNVGRHLQGEADFTLFKKTVHEVDAVTAAEFILDLLGGNGNINPDGPVNFSNIPPAFNGIAVGLQKLLDAQGRSSSPEDVYATWEELSYPAADLDRLSLNRSTPRDVAITRVAFMGREHQKADTDQARTDIASLRDAFDELDVSEATISALQDAAGLDLGFTPHVMEALRQKVGTPAAYKHLVGIIGQICESDLVRSRAHNEALTINLNNKFDWRNVTDSSAIGITMSERDANGVANVDFSVH